MKKRHVVTLVLCGVIVILLAVVGVLFWKYQQAKSPTASEGEKTSARVVEKVANLYMVPSDEEPTVAQIQDKDKLGNQDFFKTAQNGDYLLVYQKAKVAIVYREDANKLVTVGPVSLGQEDGQDQNQEGQTAGAETSPESTGE